MTTIEINHNLDEHIERLKKAPEIIQRNLLRAMKNVLPAVFDAKILPNVPIGATKGLYNSFGSEIKTVSEMHIVGTYGSSMKEEYPQYVESGRPAGASPRVTQEDLLPWVTRKLDLSGKDAERAAFLISRKINKEGFEGQFFFRDGILEAKPIVEAEFKKVPKWVIEELEGLV